MLYQLGFPQLGQIQSGNIFIEGDTLRLGGFENVLLGYANAESEKFHEYRGHIDRIMFGKHIQRQCLCNNRLLMLFILVKKLTLAVHPSLSAAGRVVFEMGAGHTPDTAIPSDTDYDKIRNGDVRKFVRDIFAPVRMDAKAVASSKESLMEESREWAKEVRGYLLMCVVIRIATLLAGGD